MNHQETASVLALLTAAFPREPELTDATVALWADEFAGADPQVAYAAARRIIREDMRFPPIARFAEMLRACHRPTALRALPTPPLDTEAGLANVAKLRQIIKDHPIVRHIDDLDRRRPGEPA